MSPAAKRATSTTKRKTRKKGDPHEIKVEGSTDKTVSVKASNGMVVVTWHCGTQRSFEVDLLRDTIELVDDFGGSYPDAWMNPSDSSARAYYTQLKNGKLTADVRCADNGLVSWAQLKRALQATIAEIRS